MSGEVVWFCIKNQSMLDTASAFTGVIDGIWFQESVMAPSARETIMARIRVVWARRMSVAMAGHVRRRHIIESKCV